MSHISLSELMENDDRGLYVFYKVFKTGIYTNLKKLCYGCYTLHHWYEFHSSSILASRNYSKERFQKIAFAVGLYKNKNQNGDYHRLW